MMQAINPATGEVLKEYPTHNDEELMRLIERSAATFQAWRQTTFAERSKLMKAAAENLRNQKLEYARLMTLEMGKTLKSAAAEADKCAWVCDYYADNAEQILSAQPISTEASSSYVRCDPLGPVLAVMPWNFPFWQVFRFAAPALMAGNVGLLKHASNVPGCALAIEQVFAESGFPEGVFTTLMITPDQVATAIEHQAVVAATLTGSEPAGVAIASKSGEQLKKVVLELGGSDPFIVLEDADLDTAVTNAVTGRMINNGQSCIAAKRFIVHESIAEAFETKFAEKMAALKMGDPLEDTTDLGPMARGKFVDELHDQVERSVKGGGKLLCGGQKPSGKGYYYPATVITNVEPGNAIFDEETFGPVAAVIRARSADHAVELANNSRFGLGSSIWTSDTTLAEHMAARIEAGCVFINSIVKSDPRLPFGGIKTSGYGRELADEGIKEFVNIKTVWVQ